MSKKIRKKKKRGKKSSVQKGDDLELYIYKKFKKEIEEGLFPCSPECATVFQKKGYYSKDRGTKIIFDVSIEVRLPGSDKIFLLFLIECKNHKKPVSVKEVDYFLRQTEQVAAASSKAIIVTSSPLQESAHNVCVSSGMAHIRVFSLEKDEWVLERNNYSPAPPSEVFIGWKNVLGFWKFCVEIPEEKNITQEDKEPYSLTIEKALKKEADQQNIDVSLILNPGYDRDLTVEYLSEKEITQKCENILKCIKYTGGYVDLLNICNYEKNKNGLKLFLNKKQNASDIYGSINFKKKKIYIYDSDCSEERKRFTLAHELGHYFLKHDRYLSIDYLSENDLNIENNRIDDSGYRQLEWQANCFASNILLPTESFMHDFLYIAKELGLRNRGNGVLFVDGQKSNWRDYYKVTNFFKSRYRVSQTVVKIKLQRLKLLNFVVDKNQKSAY